ncbi:RluA family pseudouridine synthase [Candidatus Poribacteria bacterium]|nr:RluA family pseudouridine synthase [Candidatus Poribacteria bacterium]
MNEWEHGPGDSADPASALPDRFVVADGDDGSRLDVYLAAHVPHLSRSRLQQLIGDSHVQVNERPAKSSLRLRSGDVIGLRLPEPRPSHLSPEPLPLGILHEDESIIVLNKPPGVVVHPAPGARTGTLVHRLLAHCPDLGTIGDSIRPGIAHRLDKDTSGVLVVAKDEASLRSLQEQFRRHTARRTYSAIVRGVPPPSGVIDAPLGRSVRDGKRMAVGGVSTRDAVTRFTVAEAFAHVGSDRGYSLLSVSLETGRTHQIRVHLSHFGFPVVGDPTYGGRTGADFEAHPLLAPALHRTDRQMLHARELTLVHPSTLVSMTFHAPAPADFVEFLTLLRSLSGSAS